MFLHFLPATPPPGLAGQFFGALFMSHYLWVVGFVQTLGGILLLANRYVLLALTILAPVIVNILTFHTLMAPEGLGPGVLALILWLIVFWPLRRYAAPLFEAKPGPLA
jgi:peptidoglycan biosynthesis protein MviN/MurJ (putative lipid II flippase)